VDLAKHPKCPSLLARIVINDILIDINRSGSLGCDIYGSSLRAFCSNTFAYSMDGALSRPMPALGAVPNPAVGA